MANPQIVSEAVAAIQAGEVQVMSDAIGAAIDKAVAEVAPEPVPGTFTQADIDAAVAASKAADAQAMSDAVAAVQAQLDAETAKDAADVAALAAVQAKLDQIKALLG